jgi:hypothetical protein
VSSLAPRSAALPRAPARNSGRERADKLLMLCVLLSVSQALSPYPYLLAVLAIGCLLLTRPAPIDTRYVQLAIALAAAAMLGFASGLDITNGVRILSTCVLLVLLAALELPRQAAAFDFAARLLAISIVLCVIGLVYALLGGPVLYTLVNPDGREALLFLTTLSNSVFPTPAGFLIRPSLIYDEPGAYAFVIDAILLLNFMIHRRLRPVDWALVGGGFVTFSAAHLIICLLVLVAARRTLLAVLPLAVLGALDFFLYQISGVSLLFGRFAIEDGALAGDNRSDLLRAALDLVQTHPAGVGPSCGWDIAACVDTFGGFGENPAFPAAFFGILPSLGYYVILLAIVVHALRKPSRHEAFVSLAVLALIAQRPFLFSIGYNILILMLFCVLLQRDTYSVRPKRVALES